MNPVHAKYGQFALVREMLETADVIANFDMSRTRHIAKMISETGRVFLTGEGSSRIFPAKNFIYRILKHGLPVTAATDGSFQAAEYNLKDWVVIGASNSGQTKEIVALLRNLEKQGHQKRIGVTANPGTLIFDATNECILLSCGKENAVAATKSVVEQALVYQSIFTHLIGCECAQDPSKARDFAREVGGIAREIMETEYDAELIQKLAGSPMIYFAGRNDGVAEELTLKTNEITRKKSDYLEGTYLLHGVEEVMNAGETCVLINPFPSECQKIKELIEGRAGLNVIAIAHEETIFPTVRIPSRPGFDSYFQLMAGWNLLVHIGVQLGINLDKPVRARKIGNEF